MQNSILSFAVLNFDQESKKRGHLKG